MVDRQVRNKRSIIVGAGVAGKELVDQLKGYHSLGYKITGFIDDNETKQGKKIKGIPVIGKTSQLENLISQHEVGNVFIAIPSAQGSLIRSIVNSCQKAKVTFRIVPRTLEIVRGKVHLESVRSVSIEDVLGRAILKSEQTELKKIFKGKRILVTGAAGSIGSELSRQLAQFEPEILVMFDWWENGLFELSQELSDHQNRVKQKMVVGNIQDRAKVEWVFDKFTPQVIFHAAAFKHVPLMEEHPEEAVKDNIYGTKILAEIAGEKKAEKFIFISTDKAVNPTSVMGATKRIGEMLCQEYNLKDQTKFISVRFGNVLNSRGSVIPIFREQIKKGGPIEVTHPEMKRYFMLISEACLLVMQAGAMGQGGEVFVLDMGKPIKILDLAKEMIKLSGLEPDKDIPIVFVGQRPGEKLFEEMLTAEEGTVATQNQKIFTAKLSEINTGRIENSLGELKKYVQNNQTAEAIKVLENIVPFYKGQARDY